MGLIQWVYASAETKPFASSDLEELLLEARLRNEGNEITGLLLYHEGSFLQILEGDEDRVEATIARIENDERHNNVSLIFRGQIDQRSFGEWRMGFCRPVKAEDIPGFVDVFRSISTRQLDLEGNKKTRREINRWLQKWPLAAKSCSLILFKSNQTTDCLPNRAIMLIH